LPDGHYTVRALRNGTEFARTTVIVSTLGLNQQFAVGLTGESALPNFPQTGQTTHIRWQESIQNFSIIGATESLTTTTSSSPRTALENPRSGSGQSGISVISGWACEATRIDVEIDGAITLQAAYGTARGDTATECGDTNNGFGLLVNWNELPDGVHTVRVLKDGVEFSRATFPVTSLGLGAFVRGLSGGFVVSDFPQTGRHTRVHWQESMQNFAITGAVLAEIDEGLCTSSTQAAVDPSGGRANFAATNPCQSRGQVQVMQVRSQNSASLTLTQPDVRTQTTGGFLACDANLNIAQGGRTFTSSDFDWLDNNGNRVCGTLAPGSSLDTFIRVKSGSSLNFNAPFDIVYTNQRVFQWVAALLPQPTIVNNNKSGVGGPPASCSLFGVPRQLQFCDGSTRIAQRLFPISSQCSIVLEGSLTIIADNNDFRVVAPRGGSFVLQPPSGGALLGIEYSGNCPATSSARASVSLFGTGVATVVLNPPQ